MRATAPSRLACIFTSLYGLVVLFCASIAVAEEDVVEEIIVTGSYIKRDNYDLASPVYVIDQADILREGTAHMGDIIKNLTFNYGTANVSNIASLPTSQDATQSQENLRGIGATLTLLDGRRAVVSNANLHYPPIAIDRIEILKDAGSALYGSEAVAGVINYIPRKRYEGASIALYRLGDDDNDYSDRQVQGIFGRRFANTHIMAAVEYRNVSRLRWLERPDYARASFAVSEIGSPGTFIVPTRFAADADGDGRISAAEVDFGFTRALLDPGCGNPANAGTTNPTEPGYRRSGVPERGRCRFDFREFFEYVPDHEVLRGVVTVSHEFNDSLEVFGELLWLRREATHRISPSTPSNRRFDLPSIAGDHPGNPYRAFVDRNGNGIVDEILGDPSANETLFAQDLNNNGIPDRDADGDGNADPGAEADTTARVLLAPDPFDPGAGVPFNEDVVPFAVRPFGKGPRGLPDVIKSDGATRIKRDTTEYRITGGVELGIPSTDWTARLSYTHGLVDSDLAIVDGSLSAMVAGLTARVLDDRIVGGLGPSGELFYNPFSTAQMQCTNRVCGDTPTAETSPAFNARAAANAVLFEVSTSNETRSTEINLLTTGELRSLKTGAISMAIGAHYRNIERTRDAPPHRNSCDAWSGCQEDRKDEEEAYAAFFELSIPALRSERWGTLDIQAAGRYSREPQRDVSSFDPKLAIRFAPVDQFAFRASWGTSFVAPRPQDDSTSTDDAVLTDETCVIAGVCAHDEILTLQTFIPNPDLDMETATIWNVGFTLRLLDGDLTLDADRVWIDFEDRLIGLGAQDVLRLDATRFQDFFDANVGSMAPDEIRNEWIDPANKLTGKFESSKILRGPTGDISEVIVFRDFNAGWVEFRGTDFSLRYRFDSGDIPWIGGEYGTFSISLGASYVHDYKFQLTPLAPTVQAAGNRNWSTGVAPPIPEWRATSRLSWLMGRHSVTMFGRYTHHVADDSAFTRFFGTNPSKIASRTTWDLQYSLRWEELFGEGRETTFTVGAINVFDTLTRPILTIGGLDTSLHDPRGRLLYARISQTL